MNLEAIAQFLEQQGLGQLGRNLFHDHMPAEVGRGLLVVCQMPVEINAYAGHRRGSFQVIAREIGEQEARLRLRSVSDALNVRGVRIGDMKFFYVRPVHEPLTFPRSEGDYVEASVNFDFAYVLQA